MTVVVAISISMVARPAAAQDKPAELIPRDLVLALLAGSGYLVAAGETDIRIGRPAEGLPASALPKEGLVMGSVTMIDRSITVVTVPGSAFAALAAVESSLIADGWTPPPSAPMAMSPRGFTDQATMPSGRPPFFCHGTDYLTVRALPRRLGESQLLISLQGLQQYSPCSPPQRAGDPYQALPMPALASPAASRTTNTSGSSGPGYYESRAQLISRLSGPELLAHYGSQLEAAGWTVQPGPAPVVVTQLWKSKDKDGNVVFGVLTITVPADAEPRQLSFRSYRP